MKLRTHPDSDAEVIEAGLWYAKQSILTAERFAALIEQAFQAIDDNPQQFPLMEGRGNPGDIRRVHLKPFPYIVVYQVTTAGAYVLAVAHTSRRPKYWRSRVIKS